MKISKNTLTIVSVIAVVLFLSIFVSLFYMNDKESFQNTDMSNEDILLQKYSRELSDMNSQQLTDLAARQRLRLDSYGLYPRSASPDLSKYALKSEILPDSVTKCTVGKAEDRDKYIHKSDIPDPGPKIDLNKYVLKSSIPPEKICPPQKEIDYSKYVLKSSLPPAQKCPPCICPKVKVSAGLCKKCPPPPKCPPPQPCREVKCPEPKPCPDSGRCPEPVPCPALDEKVRYDIKYIKVPTVITKVVQVDENGNVLKTEIKGDKDIPNGVINKLNSTSLNSGLNQNGDNEINAKFNSNNEEGILEESYNVAKSIKKMRMNNNRNNNNINNRRNNNNNINNRRNNNNNNYNMLNDYKCSSPELNSEFKRQGIYGYPI